MHKTQDALLDRLITIQLEHYDRDTEVQITMACSGVAQTDAEIIVDLARDLRSTGVNSRPTIRACIAIARILAARQPTRAPRTPSSNGSVAMSSIPITRESRGGKTLVPQKVEEAMLVKACKAAPAHRQPRQFLRTPHQPLRTPPDPKNSRPCQPRITPRAAGSVGSNISTRQSGGGKSLNNKNPMLKSMVILKGAAHIRTLRQIKSFRSGGTSTGVSPARLDRGRLLFEYERLICRERRRRWFSNSGADVAGRSVNKR